MLILVRTIFGDIEAIAFLLLVCVVSVVSPFLVQAMYSWFMRNHVPESAKRHIEETIGYTDESEETVQEALLADYPNRCNRIRKIAALAALACRAKFGFKFRTESNEMVARKWIHDHVSSLKDMRRSDIPMIMPFAIELCFIPSKAELEAKAMWQTAVARNRVAALEATFWDWGVGLFRGSRTVSG